MLLSQRKIDPLTELTPTSGIVSSLSDPSRLPLITRERVGGVMTAARASAELPLVTVPPINAEQRPLVSRA